MIDHISLAVRDLDRAARSVAEVEKEMTSVAAERM